MTIWGTNRDWWERHRSADLVYRVRVRFDSEAARDEVWRTLRSEGQVDGGAVLLGGASLEACGAMCLEAVSGGEDALDSLEYALDETLADVVARCGVARPTVVREVRELVEDA